MTGLMSVEPASSADVVSSVRGWIQIEKPADRQEDRSSRADEVLVPAGSRE